MSLVVAVISIIVCSIAYRIIRYKLIIGKIPSPKSLPIVGLIVEILRDDQVALFKRFCNYAKQHNGIYRLPLMFDDIVQIYNAEDMEQILKSNVHLSKGITYSFLQNWLGTGLLTSDGEKWRRRRKLLTPAFHFQILQEFQTYFNEETRRFVKQIKGNIEQCKEDIKPLIVSFTMRTICETAMGLGNIDDDRVMDYRINIQKYVEIFVKRTQRILWRFPFFYNLSNAAKQQQNLVRDMHSFSHDIINNRMKMRVGSSIKKKRMVMLDVLLNSKEEGEQVDMEGIQEEVDTFIFEGHDTTAAALNCLLVLLANHPDIQEKARKEIHGVFDGEDRDCTPEDLSKLEYVERCIKEMLRIFPAVPAISRKSSETFTTTTGYEIPKGTTIKLHIYSLHRDSKYFPDPEKFDPERFTPENCRKRPPFSYIPFSGGPRNCIGQRFAMMEMKTFLCGILKNFKLEAIDKPEDLIFQADLVLSTHNPIRVKFLKI